MVILLALFGALSIIIACVGMSEYAEVAIIFLLNGIIEITAAIRLKKLKSNPIVLEKVIEVPKYIGVPQDPVEAPPVEEKADPPQPKVPRVGSMSGVDFELFCMRVLEGYGFTNLQQTPASGDKGVDIIAWKGGKKYAIQCKRYKQNVGYDAIKEVYTGKQLYAASEAVVMASSGFTDSAKKSASELGVILWGKKELKHLMDMAGIDDVKL